MIVAWHHQQKARGARVPAREPDPVPWTLGWVTLPWAWQQARVGGVVRVGWGGRFSRSAIGRWTPRKTSGCDAVWSDSL